MILGCFYVWKFPTIRFSSSKSIFNWILTNFYLFVFNFCNFSNSLKFCRISLYFRVLPPFIASQNWHFSKTRNNSISPSISCPHLFWEALIVHEPGKRGQLSTSWYFRLPHLLHQSALPALSGPEQKQLERALLHLGFVPNLVVNGTIPFGLLLGLFALAKAHFWVKILLVSKLDIYMPKIKN